MLIRLRKRIGQNTAEYAILIGVIVAAAIAMQIYIRRGLQARVKQAVDFTMTADSNMFTLNQYEPYYQQSTITTEQTGERSELLQEGGGIIRDVRGDVAQRTGNQVFGNYQAGN